MDMRRMIGELISTSPEPSSKSKYREEFKRISPTQIIEENLDLVHVTEFDGNSGACEDDEQDITLEQFEKSILLAEGSLSPIPFVKLGWPDFTRITVGNSKTIFARFRQVFTPISLAIDIQPTFQNEYVATYRVFSVAASGPKGKNTINKFVHNIVKIYGYLILGCLQFKLDLSDDEIEALLVLALLEEDKCKRCGSTVCKDHTELFYRIAVKINDEFSLLVRPKEETLKVAEPSKFTEQALLDNPLPCYESFFNNMRPTVKSSSNQTKQLIPIHQTNQSSCVFITFRDTKGNMISLKPLHSIKEVTIYTKWSSCDVKNE